MSDSRKFIPINDEVTLLRETHRLVLSWQSLGTEPFRSFLVSLHPQDLVDLGRFLQGVVPEFTSGDGELGVARRGEELELSFARRGDDECAALTLSSDARELFESTIHRLKKR